MASVCWICRRIPRHPDEQRKSTHERPLRQRSHLVDRAAHLRDSARAPDAVCAGDAVCAADAADAVPIRRAARGTGAIRIRGTICAGDAVPHGVYGGATIPARAGFETVREQSSQALAHRRWYRNRGRGRRRCHRRGQRQFRHDRVGRVRQLAACRAAQCRERRERLWIGRFRF